MDLENRKLWISGKDISSGRKKTWCEQRQGSKNMARRMRSPKKVARITGWRVGKQDGSWKTLSNSKSETFSESH